MLDLDWSAFAPVVADRRFVAAVAIAVLGGLVRGFAGFGSALIYIPLISAVYEPRIAAATMLLIDFSGTTPFSIRELWRCDWREVLPVLLSAAAAIPVGALALILVDPVVLRWVISVMVIVLLAVLVSGWRYHGKPTIPVMVLVGASSGLGSGAVQIAGPPVIIFWLSGRQNAVTVRANLMVFFLAMNVVGCITYAMQGLITRDVVLLALCLGLPFIAAMWFGVRFFHAASEGTFRWIAYAIVALSALASLPLFDGLFR